MSNPTVIETLRCALFNCDNIRKLGEVGIVLVKEQIRAAINELEGKEPEALPDAERGEPK